MAALRVGPGTADDTQVGPLVNEEAAVARSTSSCRGAVAAGAPRGHRRHAAPSATGLLLHADRARSTYRADAAILGEEIFGPVAPIVTFTDEDEAIRLANDTEYGLVSYVYTGDLARGLRVSERLESGMVGLNRGLVSDPAAPFGGVKQTGIGREGGHEGMLDYLESKYIAVSW